MKKLLLSFLLLLVGIVAVACDPTPIEDPEDEVFQVVFDMQDGTSIMVTDIPKGSLIQTIKPSNPTKEGYTFGGWYKDIEFTTLWNFDVDIITSDTTLYAKWIEIEPEPELEYVTITFDTQGGSSISPQTIEKGTKATLPQDPTKPGYTFIGWALDIDAEALFDFNEVIEEDITLYAIFEEVIIPVEKVTVTIFPNKDLPATLEVDKDSKLIPLETSLETFVIAGFYKDLQFTNPWDFDVDVVTEDMVLYVKWEVKVITYTIFFDTQGGSSIPPLEKESGSTLNAPLAPTKNGYAFQGWYLDEALTQSATFPMTVISNMTLYAKWEEVIVPTYIVTFDTDGGTEIEPILVYENEKISAPSAPIKEGFIFVGWYLGNVLFNFNTAITADITLVAHYIEAGESTHTLTTGVYYEAMWATFEDHVPNQVNAFYKESNSSTWIQVDQELIRATQIPGVSRVDMVGLKAGTYDIQIIHSNNEISTEFGIEVLPHDRSGYAHFNYTEGIGAYLDDGTLKPDAIVVYVTDENKDSITIPGIDQVGLGWILNNNQYSQSMPNQLSKINVPLVFRFIGTVTAPQGVTAYNSTLNGGSVGDNGNMVRMKDAKHITIEGIGEDAVIDGWGFHFIALSPGRGIGFEVRNVTFINYAEDALGAEGQQSGNTLTVPVQRVWFHNLTFYSGYAENPAESDKAYGDGSADFKRGQYFTLSYSQFIGTHKTNLIGSSDSSLQYHITMHHNLWLNIQSRGPLARQANIHMYNNVFEVTDDNINEISYAQNPRANALIFSEANYFYGVKNPSTLDSGGKIKSYGDIKYSSFGDDDATVVANRTDTITTGNIFGNFDINPDIFYYDSVNQKSDVMHLTDAITARAEVYAYAGTYRVYSEPDMDLVKISNQEPQVITEDLSIPDTKINKGQPLLVFTLLTNATVTLTQGSSSYKPVLVTIYGEPILKGSGVVDLGPGTYVVESEIAHGASKGTSNAKESRAALTIEIDNEEASLARLEAYQDALNALPETIMYNEEHFELIQAARTLYNLLKDDEKAMVDETPLLIAEDAYYNAGLAQVKQKIALFDDENLEEVELSEIKALHEEYLFFLSVSEDAFTQDETEKMEDLWSYYLSMNAPTITHNFELYEYESDFFTIQTNGFNPTKYGTAIYNGVEYYYGYKMDSKGLITFTIDSPITLVIVLGPSGSNNTVKVSGITYPVPEPTVLEIDFSTPGTYSIEKGNGEVGIFYLEVKPLA